MSIKRLSVNAVLTAIALGIFVLEAQLPPLTPIPGMKLGLANLVTLFALVYLTPKDALLILLSRILLGTLFTGNPSVLLYSLSGGMASLILELLLLQHGQKQFLWGVSALGALTHNAIQLLIATLMTQTPAILFYSPVLGISGILTGLFTGLCIHYLDQHAGKRFHQLFDEK